MDLLLNSVLVDTNVPAVKPGNVPNLVPLHARIYSARAMISLSDLPLASCPFISLIAHVLSTIYFQFVFYLALPLPSSTSTKYPSARNPLFSVSLPGRILIDSFLSSVTMMDPL